MVKLYSSRAHDGDYFWLRYKHTEERLYHNLVIDGGRKANASDFCEMLRTIQENGEQVDAVFLTHFDRDHIMGMLAGMQKALQTKLYPGNWKVVLEHGKRLIGSTMKAGTKNMVRCLKNRCGFPAWTHGATQLATWNS